ncbi:MAG: hydantoinase B/oxoprolinase family protein [Actinobacteria bacterium]|nr:hydantoinase B/oxoprolinase family protein [Actinomycetota bacterium]
MRDPATFEVFKNAIVGLANEMAITVIRTAHSQIMAESMDFSTALCDSQGRVVAQGNCTPLHLGAVPAAMDAVLARHAEDLHEGDVFALNDPDEGGSHLPDIFVITPAFLAGRLEGFAVAMGHHADIGGRVAGGNAVDSTEIFQEGLQIPVSRLASKGVTNETLIALLTRNVRVPDLVLGDLQAQVAACHTGVNGLRALVERHGPERFRSLVDELLDYSETLLRNRLEQLPDGEWSFEDCLDDDGFGGGRVPIRVRVTVRGSEVAFDFTGSAPQVPSALNATASLTMSATYAALQAAVGEDIPANAGFYRPLSFTVPKGTVLNGRRPAARNARGILGYRVVDTIWGALAGVLPDRIPACGDGGPNGIAVGATDADGTQTVLMDACFGAWGGRPSGDGLDGASPLAGNLANTPVEDIERTGLVRVERYGFLPDSGGVGTWRGGLSIVRELRLEREDATLQIRSDRREHRPYGLAGGGPGGACWNILNPDGEARVLPSKVTTSFRRGDVHRHVTAGGGGYGDPLRRDPARVLADVIAEKVTPASARRDYGVVIDDGELDEDATAALREELRGAGREPEPAEAP